MSVAMVVNSALREPISFGPSADLQVWAERFDPTSFPVLAATAAQIEALRQMEDEVDAHLLGEAIGEDPLMSLKVMAHVARLRAGREGGEPETPTGALIMLGIPPFFRDFPAQATVEDWLAGQPDALEGFRRVLARSHRAARFAMAFAAHRVDHDAAVIHQAALLHDFAELLVWLHAPALALEIARRQRRDPALRSAAAQRDVLGVELAALQHYLMLRWRLPTLLATITDDHARNETAQAANVRLAIRVARHSAHGWENPALPDDYADIARLLQLAPVHVQKLLLDIDSG
jgi:HD-like signal output (HDOD) protein